MGEIAADMPGLKPEWFTKETTEPFVKHINDGKEHFLISVTPIFTMDKRTPFMFVYLKMNTMHAEAEKAAIQRMFLLGSLATILVTSIAIFLMIKFSIFTRIQSLLRLFKRVENGDMSVRTENQLVPDEIGILQQGVDSMIHQLQQTISALEHSQKRYRSVVEDMPAMICRFNPDGTLTFASNEYRTFFSPE